MESNKTGNTLQIASALTDLLENRFQVGGLKFGMDPVLGLLPGIGDALGFFLSAYLLILAVRTDIPRSAIIRMGFNIIIDLILGSIPLLGDIFDVTFKANTRNLEILKRYSSDRIFSDET